MAMIKSCHWRSFGPVIIGTLISIIGGACATSQKNDIAEEESQEQTQVSQNKHRRSWCPSSNCRLFLRFGNSELEDGKKSLPGTSCWKGRHCQES